ncbi:C40 family peptidase [Stomatohabitans albus]|uniref:C40 family peptidase n=1 Tax=Stomatohabitans albus TaxID=3110766 RepID=UPI00300C193D
MAVRSPYAPADIAKFVTFPASSGRVSHFGGPRDRGVSAAETMSVVANAGAGKELCRSPRDWHYIACRWGYVTETLKGNGAPVRRVCQELLRQRVLVTFQGRGYVCQPRDWGPNIRTRRQADISPVAIQSLGARTDATVQLFWVPPSTPLGPVIPAQVQALTAGQPIAATPQPGQVQAPGASSNPSVSWVTPGPVSAGLVSMRGAAQIYGPAQIFFDGSMFGGEIAGGSLDRTIEGADTLTVQVHDPHRTAITGGIASKARLVPIGDQVFSLDGARKSGSQLTLTLPVAEAVTMMHHKLTSPIGQQAGAGTRAQFINHLAGLAEVKAVLPPGGEIIKKAITTKPDESLWEASGRVAAEVGWRRFIAGSVLVAGPDKWLLERVPALEWREHRGGVDTIDFDLVAGEQAAKASVACDLSLWGVSPGQPVKLAGVGPADGLWLVESVARPLGSTQARVQLVRAQPALPEPDNEPTPVFSDAGISGPTGGQLDQIGGFTPPNPRQPQGEPPHIRSARTQLGVPYLFGGKRPDGKPGRWRLDCSGLVQWSLRNAYGLRIPAGSTQQRDWLRKHGTRVSMDQARSTVGVVIWKPGHIAFSMGGSRTIEQPKTGDVCKIGKMGNRFVEAYWPAR